MLVFNINKQKVKKRNVRSNERTIPNMYCYLVLFNDVFLSSVLFSTFSLNDIIVIKIYL